MGGLGDSERDRLAAWEMKGERRADTGAVTPDLLLVDSANTDLLNLSPTPLGVATLGEDWGLDLTGETTWKNPPSNRLSVLNRDFSSSFFLLISALF